MVAIAVCVALVCVLASAAWTLPVSEDEGNDLVDSVLDDYAKLAEKEPIQLPREVGDWPRADVQLGEVPGVAVASTGDVYVFHRADRPWDEDTFDPITNEMAEDRRVNITVDTIVKLSAQTGEVLESLGANRFYVPHGLTVDKEDNLWLTDVGTHQVFRIPRGQREPDLILGEKFVPKNDDTHFCKPTDVAVAQNGDFFVADGYCNSRILKFSKDGTLLGKFGMDIVGAGLDSPYSFKIPHSLALVEHLDIICVADRENQRALCFNAGLKDSNLGQFNRTVVPEGEVGLVYALAYDSNVDVMHVAALLSRIPVLNQGFSYSPARAFTYDLKGNYLGGWGYITPSEAEYGPSIPHDIAVSPTGNELYIADVLQQTVLKFALPDQQQ